jgi:hypothetical protein
VDLFRKEIIHHDGFRKSNIAIQAAIGVLFFLSRPPPGSKYESIGGNTAPLAQFLVDIIQVTIEHADCLISDLVDQFEEHGMLMDTGESHQWVEYLPVLKLIVRYLNSELFISFFTSTDTSIMCKYLGLVATKISRLQKEVYSRFSTTELPWFAEDISLKGYAPLQRTWFANEDMIDVNKWDGFDMTRMRCHEFMLGVERLCEGTVLRY